VAGTPGAAGREERAGVPGLQRAAIGVQALNLTVEEFETSHRRPDLYAVRPGHVMPEFEEVVEEHDEYWILRKFTSEEIEQQSVSTSE
jgi:hypothetical protein